MRARYREKWEIKENLHSSLDLWDSIMEKRAVTVHMSDGLKKGFIRVSTFFSSSQARARVWELNFEDAISDIGRHLTGVNTFSESNVSTER